MPRRALRWGLLSLLVAACAPAPDDEEAHVLDGQPQLLDDGKADADGVQERTPAPSAGGGVRSGQ